MDIEHNFNKPQDDEMEEKNSAPPHTTRKKYAADNKLLINFMFHIKKG